MDVMRWRYGETNPVVAPVLSNTVIEIGDLLFLDTVALPASRMCSLKLFHNSFLGVAMQRSRLGDVEPIRVATTGVFEFPCVPGVYGLGYKFGPMVGNNMLENQRVNSVGCASLAIGRCARSVDTPDSKVLIDIVSTIMYGGVQPVYVG